MRLAEEGVVDLYGGGGGVRHLDGGAREGCQAGVGLVGEGASSTLVRVMGESGILGCMGII